MHDLSAPLALSELLSRNLRAVRARIEAACARAGRDPESVELVAVTKSVPPPIASALAALGQRELAENRFEPLDAKRAQLAADGRDVRWHYVGHLQRNKARRVAALAEVIHGVDTARLAATLGRLCDEEGWTREVHLQVKLADEEAKAGLSPAEVPEAVEATRGHAGLELAGLMTMAPALDGSDAARDRARGVFDALRELAEELPADAFRGGAPRLSMGMSGDFELAIEAGSHRVRVGRALFEGLDALASADGTGGQG